MRIARLLSVGLLLGVICNCSLSAQQFWMSGIPVNWMNKQLQLPPNDFMDAFTANAPWQEGLKKVSVFKVPSQLVLFGSDEQIRTVFEAMHQRHVKMAIEMGSVVHLEACGGGEGYAGADLADKIGRRLKTLGLTLDMMALDEPVWFAHEDTWDKVAGAPPCAYPLPKVAKLAGMTVAHMRSYFPAIEVGEIEPVTPDRVSPAKLIADYVQFARLLEQETGKKLAFFHADIAVRSKGPWLPVLAMLKHGMRQIGVPLGAVIGGTPSQTTEAEWTQAGLNLLAKISASETTSLDQIIIQSWQPLPTHMLPETKPGTSTYLLLQSERMMEKKRQG